MEKVAQSERKVLFIKIIPFVILGITLLTIGLSFIGKFYDVLLEGETVPYKLASLLTEDHLGLRIRFFFWIVYIVMPLLASGLIFFYKKNKNFAFVAMLIFLTCGIVCLVTKEVFPQALYYRFKREVSIEIEELYFASIVPVVSYFILSLLVLSFASEDVKFSTKDITESGVLIAAALALNFIRLFPAPTGGSVNLQMLPLFILAIRKGPVKAFVGCGIVYGLISCLTDGYGFATFPFDYLLGIGSAAILGLFSKQILNENVENYNLKSELFLFFGVALATTMRFVAGTISSMLIYDYMIVPAMIYNVGYIFISGAIALAVIMALYGPISKINKQFPSK